ncbi:MAG: zinc ribbon domain-containing protein [Clostridia bacterium]|nr:zinc ribbon domain-containing protein [Clostridia bacterium]
MPFCEFCGERLLDEQNLCPNCGKSVDEPFVQTAQNDEPANAEPTAGQGEQQPAEAAPVETVVVPAKKRSKAAVLIPVAVLVALIAAAGILMWRLGIFDAKQKLYGSWYLEAEVEQETPRKAEPEEALRIALDNTSELWNGYLMNRSAAQTASTGYEMYLELTDVDTYGNEEVEAILSMIETVRLEGEAHQNVEENKQLLDFDLSLGGIDLVGFTGVSDGSSFAILGRDSGRYVTMAPGEMFVSGAMRGMSLDSEFLFEIDARLNELVSGEGLVTVEEAELIDYEGNAVECVANTITFNEEAHTAFLMMASDLFLEMGFDDYYVEMVLMELEDAEVDLVYYTAADRVVKVDVAFTIDDETVSCEMDYLLGTLNLDSSVLTLEMQTYDYLTGSLSLTVPELDLEIDANFDYSQTERSPMGGAYGSFEMSIYYEGESFGTITLTTGANENGGSDMVLRIQGLVIPDSIAINDAKLILHLTDEPGTLSWPEGEPEEVDYYTFYEVLEEGISPLLEMIMGAYLGV